MKRALPIFAFLLLFATVTTIAQAQGRPAGIRITVTNVDSTSGQVDFDVTLNTATYYGYGTISPRYGLLGSYVFTSFYATTYPPGYTGQLLNPVVPAIDYGDGSVVGNIQIPQVGPNQYRGSFSHTYPGPGTYDLRASANSVLLGPTTSVTFTTGNQVTNPNQYSSGSQTIYGSWVGRSFFGGATTYRLVGPVGNVHVWGVSNSVTSGSPYGAAGGGLAITAPPVIEVPTASDFGLLILALLLGGMGAVILRR